MAIFQPEFAGSEELRLEVTALWPTAAAEAAEKKKEVKEAADKNDKREE